MDDFFSAPAQLAADVHDDDNVDQFAKAIAGRFNTTDRPLFTTRLTLAPTTVAPAAASARNASPVSPSTPPTATRQAFRSERKGVSLPSSTPATPLSNMTLNSMSSRPSTSALSFSSASAAPAPSFTAVAPANLQQFLASPNVLVLDIRPHSAYSASRLPHAISLSVPSTLLKRPAFTLQKLGTMLSSSTARSRFSGWNNASRILAYDADSAHLHEGSNLLGLLRKFRAEGFGGEVAWLQGGIQSLWRDRRQLVDEGPVSEDEDESESPRFLRAGDLPKTAFQHASTTTIHTRGQAATSPTAFFGPSALAKSALVVSQASQATPMLRMAANPFYDNIRQNIELSQGITDRIPLRLSPTIVARTRELPFPWLREIATAAGQDEGTEALAMQFYRIELGEQRRMQGIMAHHSTQSGIAEAPTGSNSSPDVKQGETPFPFSITAGVEKGTKNRYRNIWPFEHARVRLKSHEHDDYVNASFVQPLGTRRRYIATQGPLPSTFTDFWTIVWEQRVRVVVMLTKQFEGGTIKCGKYWSDGQYGPFQLKHISTSGAKEEDDPGGLNRTGSASGEFFGLSSLDGKETKVGEDDLNNHTIRRKFELRHSSYPHKKPRIITQLQYLGWPDMNVPDTPKGLLSFMRQVDELVDEANAEPDSEDDNPRKNRPALLHCSAGVGRTGAFIVIDAVLDGIRRELRRTISEMKKNSSDLHNDSCLNDKDRAQDAMDIDTHNSFANGLPSFPSVSSSFSFTRSSEATPRSTRMLSSNIPTTHEMFDKPDAGDSTNPTSVPSSTSLISHKTPRPTQTLDSFTSEPANSLGTLRTSGFPRTSFTRTSTIGGKAGAPRHVMADFTIADADSMFTSAALNPAFAMDVESIQPQSKQFTSSSSSGEGSASGGDLASSSSASSGGRIRPLQLELAKMSSSDDMPGPTDRSDSDSFVPARLSLRSRNDDRIGSMSGSGEGGPSTSAGSTSAGGYSSASSFGLRSSSIPGRSESASGTASPFGGAQASSDDSPHPQSHHHPRGIMHKPSLLAPKPRLAMQPANLLESPEKSPVIAVPARLRVESKCSSTSQSSSTENSSMFSPSSAHRESSETLLSADDSSQSPEPRELPKPEIRHLAGTSFDYVVPRDLHGDDSPPLLSSLEEPIREILEDMREQRMSLCQSLRQYVFVHNAIIEGALQIADDERRRAGIEDLNAFLGTQSDFAGRNASQLSQTTGKRGASPTELPREDKKGDVALVKRPSIKRGKSLSASSNASSAGEVG